MTRKKPELLAPAGNLEKLKTALHYGADAVYAGLPDFSLRAQTGEFQEKDLEEWIRFTQSRNKKIYITANIVAHNRDLDGMRRHAEFLSSVKPDGIIVADPGALRIFRDGVPGVPIHVSTQANVTNVEAARMWQEMGASRIVIARELALDEIRAMCEIPDLEIETFVHGAVCIAYSGRCYISSYMANRSGNKGACANSCRWNYYLVEEKRPGEYYPVYEDKRGVQIMSSRDLKMLEHIGLLMEAGVDSLKLEGRMKGINYAAGVVKVYREALDMIYEGEDISQKVEAWNDELAMFSSRGFTTGMYFGQQPDDDYNFDGPAYIKPDWELAGVIQDDFEGERVISVRNTLREGDELVCLTPGIEDQVFKLEGIKMHPWGTPADTAKNGQTIRLSLPSSVRKGDLIRKKVERKPDFVPVQPGHAMR